MAANLNTDIRAELESAIATAFPTTPTAWHNVPFDPPDALWIRPIVSYGGEAAIAQGYDQQVGAFVVEVFAPLSEGDTSLLSAIATLKTTFYRKRLGESNLYVKDILAIRDLTGNDAYNGKAIDFAFHAISAF